MPPNFSTSFLIGVQKRVLPRDSHYFLLAPIKWGILARKPTKNQHQNRQKFSTNFLQGTPKRFLPRDSHYFLSDPINPFMGRYLGGIWNTFGGYLEVKLTQNKPKTYQKQLQKFSTNFLIGVQKRVLPRDSHYFLLAPIRGDFLASLAPVLTPP